MNYSDWFFKCRFLIFVGGEQSTSECQTDSPFVKRRSRCPSSASVAAPSATSAVVETMREVVAVMKESQKDDDQNTVFAKFILSELQSLSEHAAKMLRTRLQRTVLEFTEEQEKIDEQVLFLSM